MIDAIEAINTRHSIRAFKPDPVPKQLLEEILQVAVRAPSWANTQQWEFAVIGGQIMTKLKEALTEMVRGGIEANPEIPWPFLPEPFNTRRKELGIRLFEAVGIGREDKQKRHDWEMSGYLFFGAPNAIIFYLDKQLGIWPLLDLGMLMQNIMLLAHVRGLGTITQAAIVRYPDVVRNIVNIPDNKKIVVAMAIGYPEPEHAANKFRSPRQPLSEVAAWRGL